MSDSNDIKKLLEVFSGEEFGNDPIDRMHEISNEIQSLAQEALDIVRKHGGNYERARQYWYGNIMANAGSPEYTETVTILSSAAELGSEEDDTDFIDEGMGRLPPDRQSWAILPATRTLFNKNKIFPEEVFSETSVWANNSGTLIAVQMRAGYNSWKPAFLVSTGKMGAEIGKVQPVYHDQTWAKSEVKIENVISMNGSDIADQGNGIGIGEKRPIWVFK